MNKDKCKVFLMMLNNILLQIDFINKIIILIGKLMKIIGCKTNEMKSQLILDINDLIHLKEIGDKWKIMKWKTNNLMKY